MSGASHLIALALLCLLPVNSLAQVVPVSRQEAVNGWIQLFDGETTFGWTPLGRATWRVANGVLVSEGEGGTLRHNSSFADFELRCEFRAPRDGGLYLRWPRDGKLAEASEVQLGEGDAAYPIGSLISQRKASASPGGAPGGWRTLEVQASGDRLTVRVDGQVTADASSARSRVGQIALRGPRGDRVEFRQVRLRPLNLQALYNGANLDGWRLTGQPEDKEKKGGRKLLNIVPLPGGGKPKMAEWSVRGGLIHAEKGTGQLESVAVFDDFVLQLDIRANGRRGDAGVLLRGEPNKPDSGYESQVRNEFKDNNRQQPVQFGTGGFVNFQPARRVLSNDGQFFTKTIVASGRHLAVWVDGYPVSDFEDRRPVGANLAREARLGKGPIALQARDANTNVDFANVRIAPLSGLTTPPTVAAAVSSAPPVPAPSPYTVNAPPPAPVPIGSPAPQSNPVIEQLAQQQQRDQQVGQLMQQGLTSTSPEHQVSVYNEVLRIDPGNQVAYNARKEAQDKIDQRVAATTRQQQEEQKKQQEAGDRESQKKRALQGAERALLRGNLSAAQADAEIARRLAPQDPEVRRLVSLIDSRLQVRQRLMYSLFGVSGVGVFGLGMVFLRRWRNRQPYLEIVDGLDKGQEFTIKDDVTRIGAIAQDGGVQNDIVLKDFERSISRFHCEIHRAEGKLYLIDIGSSNGTFLDGKRIRPESWTRLGRGSRVRVGKTCSLRVGYRASR